MPHALTIAVLLGVVFLAAYCGGGEMFVDSPRVPSRVMPSGARDPDEVYVPPAHTIRPVIHDAYGIPEHHFGDAPLDAAGESGGVSPSAEQAHGGLLAAATSQAGTETVVDASCAPGYEKSLADGTCVPVTAAASGAGPTAIDGMLSDMEGMMGTAA